MLSPTVTGLWQTVTGRTIPAHSREVRTVRTGGSSVGPYRRAASVPCGEFPRRSDAVGVAHPDGGAGPMTALCTAPGQPIVLGVGWSHGGGVLPHPVQERRGNGCGGRT